MIPKFVYESYSLDSHTLKFNYSSGDHRFTHQVVFENLTGQLDPNLIFHLGLAEMFSYWKLFCSHEIEIAAGHLTSDQIKFWHKLAVNGMGQYFYENKIDFTAPDFLTITSTNNRMPTNANRMPTNDKVLVPIGGGKDSIVTLELLKPHFEVRPIIVYPTTPASLRIAKDPIIVRRILDPYMLQLTKQGYLTGHIPYSAILAFIFLIPQYKYIAVSNERSSDEGNVEYLGHSINHQYSKTLEFETDFNKYIESWTLNLEYFSFLRPLYELQIAKLFSKIPKYFDTFRSCNRNQQQDSWCGHCPKCISTALLLKPFLSKEQIIKIIGSYPSEDEMRQLTISKPFECILTRAEAQAALTGQGLEKILSSWQDNPNMPHEFTKILKAAL
ncbi:MAG: hypothetical protein G01um101416_659 [Microgenomates group bacterium Gr01-1014_16]|nr:MAG: hypothetical protein G01um101416_659 [Microgenomates group bacterium Gr01-1014_16]